MQQSDKQIVDALIDAMAARPEDFQIDEHYLKDQKSGLAVWIYSERWNYCVAEPFEMPFGLRQSWRFHRYLNRFKAWRAGQLLSLEGA